MIETKILSRYLHSNALIFFIELAEVCVSTVTPKSSLDLLRKTMIASYACICPSGTQDRASYIVGRLGAKEARSFAAPPCRSEERKHNIDLMWKQLTVEGAVL